MHLLRYRIPEDADERAAQTHFLRMSDQCFYCGERLLDRDLVCWQGSDEDDTQIWMHASCAKELGVHLIGDHMRWRAERGDFTAKVRKGAA